MVKTPRTSKFAVGAAQQRFMGSSGIERMLRARHARYNGLQLPATLHGEGHRRGDTRPDDDVWAGAVPVTQRAQSYA